MKTVITLIANPAIEQLSKAFIARVSERLADTGIKITAQNWLADNEACDIHLSHDDKEGTIKAIVAEEIGGASIDFIYQLSEHRKKKLLIADMDSTMITCECIDEIADELGIKNKVATITEAAMEGKIDFETALKERVSMLKGVSEQALEKIFNERIHYTDGARELVATMNKSKAKTLLVSGGFTFFTSRVAQVLGFTENYGNQLGIASGALTGTVIPPILGANAKLERLNHACAHYEIKPLDVLAVGDGANDLPMIKAAGLGVAFHGKTIMVKESKAAIHHTGLTSLLFLQGYHREEFCS